MFKGHTYSAQKKLNHFFDTLKKSPEILNILEKTKNSSEKLSVSDFPEIKEIINESFLSDAEKLEVPFSAYKGGDPFIFVSYSHSDKLQVYPIIDHLYKADFNLWFDEGIPIGEDWNKNISNKIRDCAAFLVFISPRIIESEYVRKEITFAIKNGKRFIAIYLKDTNLPEDLDAEISHIQAMNKFLMLESEFYDKIKKVLSSGL